MDYLSNLTNAFDSMSPIVRRIALAIVACVAIFAFFTFLAASMVAEKIGERVEKLGDRAIDVAQAEERRERLAREGWGEDVVSIRSSNHGMSARDAAARRERAEAGWGDR